MFGKKSTSTDDPYREVITEDDSVGTGVAPAPQAASGVHTPLDEVTQGLSEPDQNNEASQVAATPTMASPILDTPAPEVKSKFIVDEVKSQEQSNDQQSPLAQEDPNLQELKRREKELEAQIITEAPVLSEKPVEQVEVAQKKPLSFAGGSGVMTPDQFVNELEASMKELEASLPPVEEVVPATPTEPAIPQGEQTGEKYQEASTPLITPYLEQEMGEAGEKQTNFDALYDSAGLVKVQSFEELYLILGQLPFFTESQSGQFAFTFLKDLIERFRRGDASINTLESTGKLKSKVLELFNQEAHS
jgi:hypothetical protein